MNVPKKYGLLRILALIIKILAWAALVLGIVGGLFGPNALPSFMGGVPEVATTMRIGLPLLGLILFAGLYSVGSIITMLISIEESTRALATHPDR
jgi:hypothetical protein